MSESLHIAIGGLCCPVGLTIETSCAAIRAGIDRLDELPWRDDEGRPVIGAALPGLEDTPLVERMLHMLASVITESGQRWQRTRIEQCIVVWPDRREAGLELDDRALASELSRRSGIELVALHRMVGNQTTAVHALIHARQQLQAQPQLDACLVCAVDSLIDIRTIAALAARARLRTLDESDGIAPGEAAAAVWVGQRVATRGGPRVLGIGLAREPATILDDRPLLGDGMTTAIRDTLSGLPLEQVDYLLSDLGGEHYHFLELSLANVRMKADTRDIWHPAEFIGSTGVAAAPIAWILAEQAGAQQWSPGSKVLCTSSAEQGERAAVLLDTPTAGPSPTHATRMRRDFAI